MQQLARWFSYRYKKKQKMRENNPLPPDSTGIFPPLDPTALSLTAPKFNSLTRTQKPRKPQLPHVYSALYYNKKIKALAEERWATDSQRNISAVVSREMLTRELWENESPEVKDEVRKEATRRYEEALAEFDTAENEARTPEEIQR
jgi:hypothetical protein